MKVQSIRTPGLGDATYLVTHQDVAVLVDPQRDVERFLSADLAGASLKYVLETHLHNDYVSGGREAARRTGAELIVPAGAGVAYEHTPAFHQEDIIGPAGLTIRPLHTPGHTPEHVSYLILIDGRPVALFSGGSLLVGSAGRSDLLGRPRFRQLAQAQFHSLRRLTALPDGVELFPTHGEGSFCTVTGAGRTTSTIGQERAENPALQHATPDTFAEAQLASLVPYPRYYAHMGTINTLGPTPLPDRPLADLSADEARALAAGGWLVDARPAPQFAAGHLPGSLGIGLSDQFAVWTGWIVPFNAPIGLVLNADQDAQAAAVQLGRIGYDNLRGVLRAPLEGAAMNRYPTVDVATFTEAFESGRARQVLDVRSPAEWAAGHLPDSLHRYVPDLADAIPTELDRREPVWLACGSGYRATIAAGLLERAGFQPIVLLGGGIPDVLRRRQAAASR